MDSLLKQVTISFKDDNYFYDTRDPIFSSSRYLNRLIFINLINEILLTDFYFDEFEIVRYYLKNLNRKMNLNQFYRILALYDYLEINSEILISYIDYPTNQYIKRNRIGECVSSLQMFIELLCADNFIHFHFTEKLVYTFSGYEEVVLSLFSDKKNENAERRIVFTNRFCTEFEKFDLISVKRLDILIFHLEIRELVVLDYEINTKFTKNLSYLSSITKIVYENYEQIIFPTNLNLLKNIKSLAIFAFGVENDFVDKINSLTELENLNFFYKKETESKLAKLKNLKKIKNLEMSNVLLSNEDLEVLYSFNKLESLKIDEEKFCHTVYYDNTFIRKIKMYHKFSEKTIYLNVIKNLKKLFLRQAELFQGKVFAEFGNLEELHLSNDIEDEDLQNIFKIKSLKKLSVRNKNEIVGSWNDIYNLENLSELTVVDLKLNPGDLESFSKIKRLKKLDMTASWYKEKGAMDFKEGFYQLEELILFRSKLTAEELKGICRITSLKKIDIADFWPQNKEEDLLALGNLIHLEELSLPNKFVNIEIFKVISKLKNLTFLNLSNLLHSSEVEDSSSSSENTSICCKAFSYYGVESMRILRDLPNLTRLHLDNFKMSDASYEIFGTFENLLELKISDFRNQKNPMVKLSKNTNLKKLYLDTNNITEEDIVAISKLKGLEYIFIHGLCYYFPNRDYFINFDNLKEATVTFYNRKKFCNTKFYNFRFPQDLNKNKN